MKSSKDYVLRVTAGSDYDKTTHKIVPVNTAESVPIESPLVNARVAIRVQNYRGLPQSSPETSPYFSHAPHQHDLYSIGFSFALTPECGDINGNELVLGNDFDEPIKDSLPPGFGTALKIVKWAVDPGLQGDVYADKPFLYGPLLSSINVLRVGEKSDGTELELDGGESLEEGADGDGAKIREEKGVPADAAARMKDYLHEAKRKDWTFEAGRTYQCDFFNPYLDFNEFSLKLPGFTLPIIKYWDGQPLRYVLKHKTADGSIDRPLFVVVFDLIPKDELDNEDAGAADTKANDEPQPAPEGEKSDASHTEQEKSTFVDEGVD